MKDSLNIIFDKIVDEIFSEDRSATINKVLFNTFNKICPICGEKLEFEVGVNVCHNCGYVKADRLIMVEKDSLRSLMINAYKFEYLEAAGVDNWEGYSAAIREGIKEDRETLEIKADSVEDIADYMLENGLV